MATEFNLPGSSYEEVQKILKGYSNAPQEATLTQLSQLVGLHSTIISRNNKFLADVGLISGGLKKSATELGTKLGRALDHDQKADIEQYWRDAVQTNEKVSGLVTTVRIKGGMSEKDFTNHVLYVSGQKNNSGNRTGARCVVEVLIAAGLLAESEGKLVVTKPTSVQEEDEKPSKGSQTEPKTDPNPVQPASPPPAGAAPVVTATGVPQVAINIQLHLPETENAEVYEKLFRALRDNLFPPPAG